MRSRYKRACDCLHAMRLVADTIGDLELPHVLHNGRDLTLGDLALWRHVAVGPMVLPHAQLCREKESTVAMVSWIVDVVDQRRAFVGACALEPMTSGTRRVEESLASDGNLRKPRLLYVDRIHTPDVAVGPTSCKTNTPRPPAKTARTRCFGRLSAKLMLHRYLQGYAPRAEEGPIGRPGERHGGEWGQDAIESGRRLSLGAG